MTRPSGTRDDDIRGWGERLPTGLPDDVADPRTGWPLIAAAVITVVGSLLPWASIDRLHKTFTGVGLGWLTLACGLLAAAMGVLIVQRRGGRGACITGVIAGIVIFMIADLVSASIKGDKAVQYDVPTDAVSIGAAVWVEVVSGVLVVVFSVRAYRRRNVEPVNG